MVIEGNYVVLQRLIPPDPPKNLGFGPYKGAWKRISPGDRDSPEGDYLESCRILLGSLARKTLP